MDFVIDKSSFDIENYKSVAPKYAKGINITYNKKGVAETWSGVYSSKDGFPMLYDKSAQAGKKGCGHSMYLQSYKRHRVAGWNAK